jgi:AbrB family looped-hinge helix DNA binding protein
MVTRAESSRLDRLLIESKNPVKSMTTPSDSVWFTTKGQVVIPAKLRRQFHIQDGTRAIVEATPEGILLKPVTKHAITRGFGLLKRKAGGKSFAEEWAEHKAEEKALEEAKYERCTRRSR